MNDFQSTVMDWFANGEIPCENSDLSASNVKVTPKTDLTDREISHDFDAESVHSSPEQRIEKEFLEILRKQSETTSLIVQTQLRSTTLAEPEVFDGSDPTEYKPFILSFERTIVQRTSNFSDLYYNLIKYTKGEAQQLVKSRNYEQPKSAYEQAREILHKTYGNEIVIACHFLTKLK